MLLRTGNPMPRRTFRLLRSSARRPGQSLPSVLDLGKARVGVFPEIKKFLPVRGPEKKGKGPDGDQEDEEGIEPYGDA